MGGKGWWRKCLGRCLSRGIENGICKRGGDKWDLVAGWVGGDGVFFFERGMELWFVKGVLLREGGGRSLREGGLGLGFVVGWWVWVWVWWLRVMGGWRLLVDGSGCGFGGGFLLEERLDWVC